MNTIERENAAVAALDLITSRLGDVLMGTELRDQLHTQVLRTFKAIDRASWVSDYPVLFKEPIPGIDLLVMRPNSAAPEEFAVKPEFGPYLDLTARCLLGAELMKFLNEDQSKEACSASYTGKDGLCYFLFKSEYREAVLASAGITRFNASENLLG